MKSYQVICVAYEIGNPSNRRVEWRCPRVATKREAQELACCLRGDTGRALSVWVPDPDTVRIIQHTEEGST